jgi:hypothetical protein
VWPVVLLACGGGTPPLQTAEPGVVFTYPADQQLDVPLGTRIVVTFSDPVAASALGACTETSGAFCLVGPGGVVDATPEVTGDGHSVQFPATTQLEAGATYQLFVRGELAPNATNLPESGPLVEFTTRAQRPRSVAPALVAVNGAPVATPEAFRPMLETSTIRLVFSEPLDPRTAQLGAGAIELVDSGGAAVPATVIAKGIHASIDPVDDLTPGETYTVRLGNQLLDLGGQPFTPATVTLTPRASGASSPIPQVLRTRQANDPGPARTRAGADRNVIEMQKPLIGRETSALLPGALAAELGDPAALGGPIAFTIRRGQRLAASGLDVKLGGEIPTGLSTGDIQIEFLTDGGGRIYRNPFQDEDQRPENERAPLYVDLSMDVAVYTVDPIGNAVISQIALGVQATGTALATDGVLAIESVASMELGLLGVTAAPTNLVLELITDPDASVDGDTEPPALIAMSPGEGTQEMTVGQGIELVFSEPVDLDRLRAGGIRLETQAGAQVATVIESHGATIVLRPRGPLPYSTSFRVVLDDVADLAGNVFTRAPIAFSTPQFATTGVAMTVLAVHPGVPCQLTGGTAQSPGRCNGGQGSDDLYRPFTLAANEPVEIEFSQPVNRNTIALGTACGTGNVRVEELDAGGACLRPVAGTVIRRERGMLFVPDVPWALGTRYRFQLVSGGDDDCDAGELCGLTGDAANFDPLNSVDGGGGGGPLTIDFTGGPASPATYLFSAAGPFTDINGDGFVNGVEVTRDENRGAMRIVSTTGDVEAARFNGPDCIPGTPENENCIYLLGAMPTQLGELTTTGCPDGGSCVPVFLTPQAMFATSLSMTTTVDAPIIGNTDIDADTGIALMRIREPAGGGPVTGYIVDGGNGRPKMMVTLDLYMDAPDMDLPLSADHDLISKPLSVSLEGPVSFLADGRIVIALANTADVPVTVNIDAPLGLGGAVNMILPAGEMKLQLVSRPLRGAEP